MCLETWFQTIAFFKCLCWPKLQATTRSTPQRVKELRFSAGFDAEVQWLWTREELSIPNHDVEVIQG